jgi:hypothetical protein
VLQSSIRGKASIRDLPTRTAELVRNAAAGAIIIIERRGEPASPGATMNGLAETCNFM